MGLRRNARSGAGWQKGVAPPAPGSRPAGLPPRIGAVTMDQHAAVIEALADVSAELAIARRDAAEAHRELERVVGEVSCVRAVVARDVRVGQTVWARGDWLAVREIEVNSYGDVILSRLDGPEARFPADWKVLVLIDHARSAASPMPGDPDEDF